MTPENTSENTSEITPEITPGETPSATSASGTASSTREGSDTEQKPREKKGRDRKSAVLIILLLLMFMLMAVLAVIFFTLRSDPGGPAALETPGFQHVRTIYGWGETPDSVLKEPYAVVWRNGSLYVTEKGRGGSVRLSPTGEFLGEYGRPGSGEGAIDQPTSLEVDDAGQVYMGDGPHSRIVVYSSTGERLRDITTTETPLVTLIDGSRMFLAAPGSIKVLALPDGNEIAAWGSRGRGEAQFDYPNGIGLGENGESLFVADGNNLRVKALTMQGDTIWTYGRPPETMNEQNRDFGLAGGVTVANGYLFVTDPLDSVIHILDLEGSVVAQVGTEGARDGEIYFPASIAYMGANRFAIAEWGNQRVQIVDIDVAAAIAEWQRTTGAGVPTTATTATTPTTN